MVSRSPSTPSEGEIVESDSEKATTSLRMINGTKVDRQSRICVSVSPSPSPYQSPRRQLSRTPSRSPYRESRGPKRRREDDHYNDRSRNDPRHFNVRYENRLGHGKVSRNTYDDLDRSRDSNPSLRYEDRAPYGRIRDKRPHTRSRSPYRPKSDVFDRGNYGRNEREGKGNKRIRVEPSGNGYRESSRGLSIEQSVSDRGQPPIATTTLRRDAENRFNQTQHASRPNQNTGHSVDESNVGVLDDSQHMAQLNKVQLVDEATLIEERRKRREAIKAKHRCQIMPVNLEALASIEVPAEVKMQSSLSVHQSQINASPQKSPHLSPKNAMGQDSPTSFVVLNDADLANHSTSGVVQEEGPSAADYDPTMDMQEDQLRSNQRHHDDESSSFSYKETAVTRQDVLIPEKMVNLPVENKTKDRFDMFAEGDEFDMFAEAIIAPEPDRPRGDVAKAFPIPQAKALVMSMLDDWDDHEGYYKVILGELLDGRYHVQSNLGKGMFSGVVRATDQKTGSLVAIKLIRNNETMKKAGLKEIEILHKLKHYDPDDRKHMIRLERSFEHKGHLCMVFENLNINLREVLKKFGRDVGINLRAVRAYAHQMFLGLSLLRKCNIIHADLKPDNVLVNESRNLLKICDLGSASDASENEITPYLVSRFYRAPEIILGMPYDYGIDVWSVGCTLFELYSGKILFTGRSNNQMLRAIMECRGKFSHRVLRKAEFAGLHFDDLLNFRSVEKDRLSGKDVVRILNLTKPTRDLKTRLFVNAKGMNDVDTKELSLFVDLLDRCLNLNPEKRCTPSEALKHPFITRMKA